jgi:hypothetical protein
MEYWSKDAFPIVDANNNLIPWAGHKQCRTDNRIIQPKEYCDCGASDCPSMRKVA